MQLTVLVISRRTLCVGCGSGSGVDCDEVDKSIGAIEVLTESDGTLCGDEVGKEANRPCEAGSWRITDNGLAYSLNNIDTRTSSSRANPSNRRR